MGILPKRAHVREVRAAAGRFAHDRRGQDLIEYALLAAAVAVLVAVALPNAVVPVMSKLYSSIGSALNAS